jgi:xanthine/uracil permease
MWMFLYGIFGKVGAFFTSIPQPVLGGMTTFLFANMTVSGIKVMTSEPVDRRERFILAVAASFGLGTILVPNLFGANFLDCGAIESPGVQGLCSAARITLSTGYAVGCLVALFLNAILPEDDEDDVVLENDDTVKTSLMDQTSRAEQDASNQSDGDESPVKETVMDA